MAKFTLMPHQAEGVKFLDQVDGIGALLFDPGTGKTGTLLTWLDGLTQRYGEVRVAIVAPLTAIDAFVLQAPDFVDVPTKVRAMEGPTKVILDKVAQARDWANVPTMPTQTDHPGIPARQRAGHRLTILCISAGAVSNYCSDRPSRVRALKAFRKYDPHVVVVDESHIIKAPTSNISQAMYQIGQVAPHRVILTGTVTPHSPLDVFGQWRFLAPWTFSDSYDEPFTKDPVNMSKARQASIRPWSWHRFKDRYTIPGGFKGKGIGGYQNLEELNERIAERSLVVKDDVLGLKTPSDITIPVRLSNKEKQAYDEMRDMLLAMLDDGSLLEAKNPLAKMMKLRQITSGFVTDSDTGKMHRIGSSKERTIVDLVNTTLAGENRVVVFSFFKAECFALAKALRGDGTGVDVITGDDKPQDRLAIRKRFGDVSGNPERRIMVAQVSTMSVAVNELVVARHAVFGSMTWQRDTWEQARKRLHRKGQKNHVTFWNVVVPNSVDTVILENIKARGDMEAAMLEHIKKVRRRKG